MKKSLCYSYETFKIIKLYILISSGTECKFTLIYEKQIYIFTFFGPYFIWMFKKIYKKYQER